MIANVSRESSHNPPELNRDLLEAVCYGNARVVSQLLAAGANPNTTTAQGYTALHVACAVNDLVIVKLLLDYHASPNKCVHNMTPFSVTLFYVGHKPGTCDEYDVISKPTLHIHHNYTQIFLNPYTVKSWGSDSCATLDDHYVETDVAAASRREILDLLLQFPLHAPGEVFNYTRHPLMLIFAHLEEFILISRQRAYDGWLGSFLGMEMAEGEYHRYLRRDIEFLLESFQKLLEKGISPDFLVFEEKTPLLTALLGRLQEWETFAFLPECVQFLKVLCQYANPDFCMDRLPFYHDPLNVLMSWKTTKHQAIKGELATFIITRSQRRMPKIALEGPSSESVQQLMTYFDQMLIAEETMYLLEKIFSGFPDSHFTLKPICSPNRASWLCALYCSKEEFLKEVHKIFQAYGVVSKMHDNPVHLEIDNIQNITQFSFSLFRSELRIKLLPTHLFMSSEPDRTSPPRRMTGSNPQKKKKYIARNSTQMPEMRIEWKEKIQRMIRKDRSGDASHSPPRPIRETRDPQTSAAAASSYSNSSSHTGVTPSAHKFGSIISDYILELFQNRRVNRLKDSLKALQDLEKVSEMAFGEKHQVKRETDFDKILIRNALLWHLLVLFDTLHTTQNKNPVPSYDIRSFFDRITDPDLFQTTLIILESELKTVVRQMLEREEEVPPHWDFSQILNRCLLVNKPPALQSLSDRQLSQIMSREIGHLRMMIEGRSLPMIVKEQLLFSAIKMSLTMISRSYHQMQVKPEAASKVAPLLLKIENGIAHEIGDGWQYYHYEELTPQEIERLVETLADFKT